MPPLPRARQSSRRPRTVGSSSFDPDGFFERWSTQPSVPATDGDFRACVIDAFGLKADDDYVYHATAAVNLQTVQAAIDYGNKAEAAAEAGDGSGKSRLKAWYLYDDGVQADIAAYTDIFSCTTSTPKALTAFASNAKKNSVRAAAAANLRSQFFVSASPGSDTRFLTVPAKLKAPITNPYYDVWAWSCRCLAWTGPTPGTASVRHSHHLLPVLYEHFGCVCPTWDAMCVVRQLCEPAGRSAAAAKGAPARRPVLELGSGNGYWAYMLRRHAGLAVHAVDNELSAWRTTWIADTIVADAVAFLADPAPPALAAQLGGKGARHAVLLLVYPQVSNDFTADVLRAFAGDTVVVAGTQNANGFTGFAAETVAQWMAREKPGWDRLCQVPLPSFAGKDDALFVFRKREKKAEG